MRIVVDLPAPLGPRKPVTDPGSARKDTRVDGRVGAVTLAEFFDNDHGSSLASAQAGTSGAGRRPADREAAGCVDQSRGWPGLWSLSRATCTPYRGDVDGSLAASPPPLTRWQSTWRYLVAVVSGVCFWVGSLYVQTDGRSPVLLAVDLVLGLVCVVLMRWRRTHPLAVAVIVNGSGAFSTFGAGAAAVVTVSLATRRRWREILIVAAVTVIANLVYFRLHEGSDDRCSSRCCSPSCSCRPERHRHVHRRPA